MDERVTLLVGYDAPEASQLADAIDGPVVVSEMLPRVRLDAGELLVSDPRRFGPPRPVGRVLYHALYDIEPEIAFVTTLALWGGPCLPNPLGMLLARPRASNLAVARKASHFAALPRTYLPSGGAFTAESPTVAKWGEWHCGEGKEVFTGERHFDQPTLLEPFVSADAVRVQVVGDRAWQIRLGGADWKKSIHHPTAAIEPPDPRLVDDVQRVMDAFALELGASDFVVAPDGTPHLLEFNHIPNVTQFTEVWTGYLAFATRWLATPV